jgi:hypothetical protein
MMFEALAVLGFGQMEATRNERIASLYTIEQKKKQPLTPKQFVAGIPGWKNLGCLPYQRHTERLEN